MRLLPPLLALACAACSTQPGTGLRVRLDFGASRALCAKVVVTGQATLQSPPLLPQPRPLVVGIAASKELGEVVTVEAFGYLTPSCTGPLVASARPQLVTFDPAQVREVFLALEDLLSPDGGTDGGVDGGTGEDGGTDAGFDGGLPDEDCANGVDDDGDQAADCDDSDCFGKACGSGRYCTAIGVCQVPQVELVCGDGVDDDGDGQTDCADTDCLGKACNDGSLCTVGDTCAAGGGCTPGGPKTCPPPGECRQGPVSCEPATGACTWSPQNGGPCDGGSCVNGSCRLGFPYTPTHFDPQLNPAFAPPVTLDCGVSTYDSRTNTFGNWCGRPTPTPVVVPKVLADDVVVLPMRGFTLAAGSTLRLTGDKPVILAVYGDATVAGHVSAGAVKAAPGAGGSTGLCVTSPGGAGALLSGGGGGGAGNKDPGSAGGRGSFVALTGGVGGTAQLVALTTTLRGGCSGGNGAVQQVGATAPRGGGGGGAVQLSVAGTLALSGRVTSPGGGGAGATPTRAGGGGGGSGGGILLEASVLQFLQSARVLANGGAGGGGDDEASDGTDGEDGHVADDAQAVGGARGGMRAGAGGPGAANGASGEGGPGSANGGGNQAGGGGGGGGATGRVHLRGVNSCSRAPGALFSPAYTGACP